MTITPTWLNDEQTILIIRYTPPIRSWDEYDAAVDLGWEMVKQSPQRVYVIHNPGNAIMPQGSAFQHLRRAMRFVPPNVEQTIAVVENPFARSILAIFIRVTRITHLTIVSSLSEGLAIAQSASIVMA